MGEGDIIRHLLFMGYSVLHSQAPLDEYDFTVNNLAVDLRDGVRLCRLVDLHCSTTNLSKVTKKGLSLLTMRVYWSMVEWIINWALHHLLFRI